jgi:hypothetical protein
MPAVEAHRHTALGRRRSDPIPMFGARYACDNASSVPSVDRRLDHGRSVMSPACLEDAGIRLALVSDGTAATRPQSDIVTREAASRR